MPQLNRLDLRIVWIRLSLESSQTERAQAIACLNQLGPQDCALFDGGEVLNVWQWWRLKRHLKKGQGHLIASLHRRRGCKVLYRTRPDWPLAKRLVRTLAGQALGTELLPVARKSFLANRGNMREVFRACYWACAKL